MQRLSLAEPVSLLRRIRIRENGEPLASFLGISDRIQLDRPRFDYRRETVARATVVEALHQAAGRLPPGYKLSVVEGWRPMHIQRRMYRAVWGRFKERNPEWSDVTLKRVVNRYTAPLDLRVPPPHSSGGAVDVVLADSEGRPLDMNSPFQMSDPAGFALDVVGLSDTARRHRDILASALGSTVLTNYPSEYWHWTYGDQGWAYRGSHPFALYGPLEPAGYTPEARDDVDAPLALLFD